MGNHLNAMLREVAKRLNILFQLIMLNGLFPRQVLLYDPLSSWTLSSEKRKALQQKAEEDDLPSVSAVGDCLDTTMGAENLAIEDNVNKMAKRMLLRLKQKLDGVEDGVHLSVSGQVNHLIREAMDPKNLCRLFPGWQPWV